MLGKRKNMALLILAKDKRKREEEDADGYGSEDSHAMGDDESADGREAAAEELIDAVRDGDAAAVVEAFESLLEQCHSCDGE